MVASASAAVSVMTAVVPAVPADPATVSAVSAEPAAVRSEPAVMPITCRRHDQVSLVSVGRA